MKNLFAKICDHCPFCSRARKNPDSLLGKLLNHPLHAKNCPLWKAHQEAHPDGQEKKAAS